MSVEFEAHQPGFYLQILSPQPLHISGDGINMKGEYNPESALFSGVGEVAIPEVDISFERKLIGNDLIMEADLSPEMLDGLSELSLDCDFDGTFGRAYLDEKLISDHSFGRFLRWEIGLREFLKSRAKLKLIFENAMEATVIPRAILRKEFTIVFDKTDEGKNGCDKCLK